MDTGTESTSGVYSSQMANDLSEPKNINESDYSICPPLRMPALIISSGIIASGIIVGNALVIIAIAGGNARFSRPMYWFIIHLSFSDLLVGLMLMWNFCLAAIFDINNSLTSLTVLHGIWVTSTCSSTLGILYLSIDRYMQVVHRRLHAHYFTQCSVGWAISLAWLLPASVFFIAPLAFSWSCQQSCKCHGQYMECYPFTECSLLIPPLTKSHILIGLIYFFCMLPWPIVMYSLIFIKARKTTQVLHKRISHRDIRLIRTLVVIMAAFLVTLAPTGAVMILDYLKTDHDNNLVEHAVFVFVLAALNSLCNPILYMWRIPAIRSSLHQRFQCCFQFSNAGQDERTTRTIQRGDDRVMSSNHSVDGHHSPLSMRPQAFGAQEKHNVHSDSGDTPSPEFKRYFRKKKRKHNYGMRMVANRMPTSNPHSPLCAGVTVTQEGKKFMFHPDGKPSEMKSGEISLHSSPST